MRYQQQAEPMGFFENFLSVFLANLLALFIFAVGAKFYIEYKIQSANEKFREIREKVK